MKIIVLIRNLSASQASNAFSAQSYEDKQCFPWSVKKMFECHVACQHAALFPNFLHTFSGVEFRVALVKRQGPQELAAEYHPDKRKFHQILLKPSVLSGTPIKTI